MVRRSRRRCEPAPTIVRLRPAAGHEAGQAPGGRLPADRYLPAAGQAPLTGPGPRRADPPGRPVRPVRPRGRAPLCSAFRLAINPGLGSRIVRAWAIVPAAVNERDVATGLLEAGRPPRDLLCDKGFNGKAFAVERLFGGDPPPAAG